MKHIALAHEAKGAGVVPPWWIPHQDQSPQLLIDLDVRSVYILKQDYLHSNYGTCCSCSQCIHGSDPPCQPFGGGSHGPPRLASSERVQTSVARHPKSSLPLQPSSPSVFPHYSILMFFIPICVCECERKRRKREFESVEVDPQWETCQWITLQTSILGRTVRVATLTDRGRAPCTEPGWESSPPPGGAVDGCSCARANRLLHKISTL